MDKLWILNITFDCIRNILLLFAHDCYYEIPSTAVVAVFAEVDALPSAHIQTAVRDGDSQTHAAQCRFGMRRHIVGTLQRMFILWSILRDKAIENSLHIHANIRISILIDAQSTTGVLTEDVDDARFGQLGQLAQYLTGYQMEAARLGF